VRTLSQFWALVCRDLMREARGKESFTSMFVFSALVLLIFNFAFESVARVDANARAGILWVALNFAGVLALSRAFAIELEDDRLRGLLLAPLDRSVLFLAKVTSNLIFNLIGGLATAVLFVLFFNLDLSWQQAGFGLVVLLGMLGFVSVGTLFAALAANTRARELMLPILLFPIMIPLIIGEVKTTAVILRGGELGSVGGWLNLMAAYDILFLAAGALVFEAAVEE
jgi:heme exporter protein B